MAVGLIHEINYAMMEMFDTKCPRCGTGLKGKPDHCPICQYEFTGNNLFLSGNLNLFLITLIIFGVMTLMAKSLSLKGGIIFNISSPLFVISLIILFSGIFALRKFYDCCTGMSPIKFSSESLSAVISIIFISFTLLLILLYFAIAGIGQSANPFYYLQTVTLIGITSYLLASSAFFILISLYGIIKFGLLRHSNMVAILGTMIFSGWLLMNMNEFLDATGISQFLFPGVQYRNIALFYIEVLGVLEMAISSIILLITLRTVPQTVNQ